MNQDIARRNFEYCRETHKLKRRAEINILDLAGRLYKIFSEKLYEPNYDTFKDYLEDLKLSSATASKLINIHLKFIVEYKFKPKFLAEVGGWSSISEVVNLVDSKKSAKEWLIKVKNLTREDLRKEIIEKKTGILMSKCPHKNTKEITLIICEDCGDKFRKHNE